MSICIKEQIQNMNIVIGCTVGCTYCYARNNVKRWHMIDDFADPEFFPGKLRMMEKKRPQNFLLTGMSDLSGWKPEWRDEVFAKIRENPQHQFLFLTKRPDLLDFDTDLENAWFGVTVTRKAERWRIDALRKNVRAKHYHVTFEPLFDDPGTVDLSGVNWIVVGTMTGAQSRKIHTEPEWAWSLTCLLYTSIRPIHQHFPPDIFLVAQKSLSACTVSCFSTYRTAPQSRCRSFPRNSTCLLYTSRCV